MANAEHDNGLLKFKDDLGREDHFQLPPGLNYFHRLVYSNLRNGSGLSELLGEYGDRVTFERMEELRPVIDYMIEPKSTAEFLDMKTAVVNAAIMSASFDATSPLMAALGILEDLNALSEDESNNLAPMISEGLTGNEFNFRRLESRPYKEVKDRVVTLEEAVTLAKKAKAAHQPVGMTFGKWRLGVHNEQGDTIDQGRKVLGTDGLYFAMVESAESIKLRRPGQVFDPDEDRLGQVARLSGVDYVCLLDPQSADSEFLNGYYDNVWGMIRPNFYFVGARDYELNPVFEERGLRYGSVLLWGRETNRISTTARVSKIRDGQLT